MPFNKCYYFTVSVSVEYGNSLTRYLPQSMLRGYDQGVGYGLILRPEGNIQVGFSPWWGPRLRALYSHWMMRGCPQFFSHVPLHNAAHNTQLTSSEWARESWRGRKLKLTSLLTQSQKWYPITFAALFFLKLIQLGLRPFTTQNDHCTW